MDAVVITGFGILSPLGQSLGELTARYAAGESAVRPLADVGGSAACGAALGDVPLEVLPAEMRARSGRLDRLCRLFLVAAARAVAAAGLDLGAIGDAAGLSFGTALGCLLTDIEYYQRIVEHGPAAASPRLFAYTVSSAAAGEVSIALGVRGANVTAHAGLAAGLQAIGYGCDLIRLGKADVVLAGGADALGDALLRGLRDMGLLKSAAAPLAAAPGICPAEGAMVAVLERREHARARGARCWARIDGYAAGFEPTLTRRERAGTAVTETARRALALSRHEPGDVDFVVTSEHATAVDAVERDGLAAAFAGAPPPLLAPKAAWGEPFGAHGALATALAAGLLQQRPELAHGVAHDRDGAPLPGGRAALGQARLAMVHSLCYAGPTVALVLAREE